MAAITIAQLTESTLEGQGTFDVLMAATRAHLENEFKKGRITGPEYASVYVQALQVTMEQALQFLLNQQKVDQEAQLLAAQVATETAQTDLVNAQITNLSKERDKLDAEIALITQQTANAVTENTILIAQECKLRAEFDQLVEMKLKTVAETALLAQKKVTEQGQTSGTGVDADSVIGRQKALYQAQADGFLRDAEQKGTKIMLDTWNVRRTTDAATVADATNKLNDETIGRVVDKLLAGINA